MCIKGHLTVHLTGVEGLQLGFVSLPHWLGSSPTDPAWCTGDRESKMSTAQLKYIVNT